MQPSSGADRLGFIVGTGLGMIVLLKKWGDGREQTEVQPHSSRSEPAARDLVYRSFHSGGGHLEIAFAVKQAAQRLDARLVSLHVLRFLKKSIDIVGWPDKYIMARQMFIFAVLLLTVSVEDAQAPPAAW